MKRDEILNMQAGNKTDVLIAKKVFNLSVMEWINHPETRPVFIGVGKDEEDKDIPYYSTDIAAAWEVVTEMQRRNCWVYVNVLSSRSQVVITDESKQPAYDGYADINNVPLAICRAALLAVMEFDE